MMKSSLMITVLTAFLLAMVTDAGAEQKKMYKWTDENGVVHFSEVKPADQQVDSIPIPSAEAPAAAQTSTEAVPNYAQERRDEIAASKKQAREQQAVTEAQCASWKSEVERLEPHRRQFITNEKGEVERVDDVQRVQHVADLKSKIAANCK